MNSIWTSNDIEVAVLDYNVVEAVLHLADIVDFLRPVFVRQTILHVCLCVERFHTFKTRELDFSTTS